MNSQLIRYWKFRRSNEKFALYKSRKFAILLSSTRCTRCTHSLQRLAMRSADERLAASMKVSLKIASVKISLWYCMYPERTLLRFRYPEIAIHRQLPRKQLIYFDMTLLNKKRSVTLNYTCIKRSSSREWRTVGTPTTDCHMYVTLHFMKSLYDIKGSFLFQNDHSDSFI